MLKVLNLKYLVKMQGSFVKRGFGTHKDKTRKLKKRYIYHTTHKKWTN